MAGPFRFRRSMSDDTSPPAQDLDALVLAVDPDRWLASRLIAEPQARSDVVALYAFDHELARAPKVASNALLGEIRLAWWREVLDEAYEGRPVRHHPTAQALAQVIARRRLPRADLELMIDARYRELDPTPMTPEEAVLWARETGGAVARLAAQILDPDASPMAAEAAGAAWALSRRWLAGEMQGDRDALASLRAQARGLSVTAFPAGAQAALSRLYAIGREPSALGKRWRITLAALTGRV